MKKTLMRLFSFALVFVVFFSMIPSAFAATCSTTININHGRYGGNKTTFYVTSSNTKKVTLKYSSVAGKIVTYDEETKKEGSSYKYGYVEVRVWGKSNGKWTELTDYKKNIKGKVSDTITMKGYTSYKVQIWTWRTPTLGAYLGGKFDWDGVYWAYTPSGCICASSNNVTKITQ